MKIIVTGGSGFVGKHIVERLISLGHNVLSIDLKDGNDLVSEQTIEYMSEKMPDVEFIISLAGTCSTPRGFKDPKEAFDNNTRSVFNLMEFARKTGAKVIHTSTVKADLSDDGMYTPYGVTKLMGEMIVREWAKSFGVKVLVNRPGTIYGEGQHGSDESGWLGWFITAAILGKEVTINGDGRQRRDILHVDDYVDLIVEEIKQFDYYRTTENEYFIVGGGDENMVSLLEAVLLINKFAKLDYKFAEPRKGDNYCFCAENLISRFGPWKPRVNWKEGIERTIKWYKENKELL